MTMRVTMRVRILLGILLATVILAACGADQGPGRKDPPSASKSAADLRVTEERMIELEGTHILSLSPDGQWLLAAKKEQLCVYRTESLAEQSCAPLQSILLAPQSVTWSPDSTRVAFADDVLKLLVDSDLWVMEAKTGKLTNLTDDGVTGDFFGSLPGGKEALLDIAPTWSPDGKTLIFSRSARVGQEWGGTFLCRISANGGDPESLLSVTSTEQLVVWHAPRWSSDRKEILYTVNHSKPDYPYNGIWKAQRDGTDPQRLTDPDPQMGPPLLMDVSAQGDKALIHYYQIAELHQIEPNVSYFVILDLHTGDMVPLKKASTEDVEFFSPWKAVFAPDGSKVLYAYLDDTARFRLAVRDLESETENALLISDDPLALNTELGLGLDWADDDTIYVATSPSSGLLLHLGTE